MESTVEKLSSAILTVFAEYELYTKGVSSQFWGYNVTDKMGDWKMHMLAPH